MYETFSRINQHEEVPLVFWIVPLGGWKDMWLCVVSLEQNPKSLKGQTDFRSNINEDRGSLQNITEQNRLEESMFPYTINSSCDPISPTALTHRS